MKCPKGTRKVEVWSHTLFFMTKRGMKEFSLGRNNRMADPIFAAVDRITTLMGISKDNRTCWWEMSPEEFESVTEGIDYETSEGEELGDAVLESEDISGH